MVSQAAPNALQHSQKSTQFNFANFFAIFAMGMGSIGYGYSANVIAPILGKYFISYDAVFFSDKIRVYPSFNE